MALPLARAPESQLTTEQSLTGRHWNTPKKYSTSKDKGQAAMRWTSTGLGKTDSTLGGHTQSSVHIRTQGKEQ